MNETAEKTHVVAWENMTTGKKGRTAPKTEDAAELVVAIANNRSFETLYWVESATPEEINRIAAIRAKLNLDTREPQQAYPVAQSEEVIA